MSSVYVLEPPTKGKVVLTTTAGPLDIELWPKEAPKAVRNFVQLCMEGYYDNTIFHRIIKTFMVQGGDPTGTGTGGDTIYGGPFVDEVHSRLRFNHRGLVACANAGTANTNNSQFFITLDRCDWLDKKNTIFGKITGDTVYNLMKLGELETDKNDRPLNPPNVVSVEVLWNPFDDIVLRNNLKQPEEASVTEASDLKQQKPIKPKKKLNLLSFGEEAEEEEQVLATVKEKLKSSHDVLNDPRLLKDSSNHAEMDEIEARRRKEVQASVRQALVGGKSDEASRKPFGSRKDDSDEDEADFDSRMRRQILEKKSQLAGSKASDTVKSGKKAKSTPRPMAVSRDSRADDDDDDDADSDREDQKEKLVIKKKGMGSEARASLAANVDVDAQLLTPLEQRRQKFKQKKRVLQGREDTTLAKLAQFRKKLEQAKVEVVTQEEKTSWLAHELKFVVDATKRDDMAKNDDPNQYVVHDPLLEKGKEKFNREQAKLKRRNREWAGNSVT